jgi:hypothetical protein
MHLTQAYVDDITIASNLNIFSLISLKDIHIRCPNRMPKMRTLQQQSATISLSRNSYLFYFLRKFWLGKFFSVSKMDKKNVQISFLKNNLPKNFICDHILFLWSRGAKKFFIFVTIKFFYFCGKVFRSFVCH